MLTIAWGGMRRASSCRDRGRGWADAGALCLSSCGYDPSASPDAGRMHRIATRTSTRPPPIPTSTPCPYRIPGPHAALPLPLPVVSIHQNKTMYDPIGLLLCIRLYRQSQHSRQAYNLRAASHIMGGYSIFGCLSQQQECLRGVQIVVHGGDKTVMEYVVFAALVAGDGAYLLEESHRFSRYLEVFGETFPGIAVVVVLQRDADGVGAVLLEQVADECEVAQRFAHLLAVLVNHAG